MIEAIRTSETSVYSNQTTRCHISEGSRLHTRCRENLKSHKVPIVLIDLLTADLYLQQTNIQPSELYKTTRNLFRKYCEVI
jgi:hypothetical protein